jgi:hypothetical protein
MAYRQNYLDLDPIYRDRYGRPLLRMTFDFHANEQKQANYNRRHLHEDRTGDGCRSRRPARPAAAL